MIAVEEVVTSFEGGPMCDPGVVRIVDASQLEYRFHDDIRGQVGLYVREPGSTVFVWQGWL